MNTIARHRSEKLLVLFSLVFAALLGGVLVAAPPKFLPYLVAACVLLAIGFLCLARPVLLLYFVILTSVFSDLFGSFESIDIGGTQLTVSGFRWVLVAGVALFVILANLREIKLPRTFWPFVAFAAWTLTRWLIGAREALGLKDILFFSLPPLIGVYSLFVLSKQKRRFAEKIQKLLLFSAVFPPLLYAVFIPLGLVVLTKSGPQGIMGRRTVALYLLIVLSLSLAHSRYGITSFSRKQGLLITFLAIATILFTLSRTASLMAFVLLGLSRITSRRWWSLVPRIAVALLLAAFLFLNFPLFQERFFFRTDLSLIESVEYFDTAGRNVMWPVTFAHALEKPIIGWGPGSARLLLGGVLTGKDAAAYHPHNEYLQVFHDLGILGLVLLLSAWIPLLIKHWNNWRTSDLNRDPLQAKWSMAAFLSIVVVLTTCITDNTLHYTFILAPVFIIVAIAHHWRDLRPESSDLLS